MATPHVFGAIALYAGRYPGASASQIRHATTLGSAIKTDSLIRKTITGGQLSIDAALQTAPR